MSQPKTASGEFRFEAVQLREIPAAQFWPRVLGLIVGVIVASVGVAYFYNNRIVGEAVALGQATRPSESSLDSVRINSFRTTDAVQYYTATAWPRGVHEGIWLGNSQIFAINQPKPGDEVAPWHLSKLLGWRVFGLNIPNANFQEYVVLQEFAMLRRKPDWVVMVLVFDDLREDGLRAELGDLVSDDLYAALRTSAVGQALAGDLQRHAKGKTGDLQGTTREKGKTWILGISLQEICEDWLEERLSHLWPVWAERPNIRTSIFVKLHQLRNWAFNINTRTVRPMLPASYTKNMAALEDAVTRNAARGTQTLMYIAPLRRDQAPPYQMDRYEAWKKDVQAMAAKHRAIYADLDTAVPDQLWGTVNGQDIDFMHYQGPAHLLVAERLAAIIKQHLEQSAAQPSSSGGAR